MLRWLSSILLVSTLVLGPSPTRADESPFPQPAAIDAQVRFWVRVYSEVGTNGGLIHDSREMGVVYEKVRFRDGTSRKARSRSIDATKDKYDKILRTLAGGKRSGLSADEQRVLAMFPDGVGKSSLLAARKRIRFQLGQADRFRSGVIRSGRWEPHIMKVLADHGVPYELAALPHVESSYNPDAYSHAGAAGLWQFTRSTGRMFMRVDHVVDERRDPYLASVAAARLLLANHVRTRTWPTAITAYNHGTAGMERAIRTLGTRDIGEIVRKYKGRTFGFASRNFYTSFLAAVEVSRNYEHYFGELVIDPPDDLAAVPLDHYYSPATLTRIFGVGERSLRAYNKSLLAPVWEGAKYVPKGHVLRFPHNPDMGEPTLRLAQIPASERILRQRPDRGYRVRRGDTLSTIARRFGVSMNDLVAMNGLRSRHRIRIGQKLKLPTHDAPTTVAMVRDHDRNARPKLARPSDGVYAVHRGDTLSGIAGTFGVSVEDLLAANSLRNKNRLSVGQKLFIPPDAAEASGTYVVRRGDSLDAIAAAHGVSRRTLQSHNNIINRNRIHVGQVLVIPGRAPAAASPARPTRYTVKRGDTLAKIAARNGTTIDAIVAASNLRNRNQIHVGQVLTLSGSTTPASAPAKPAVAAAVDPPPAAPEPPSPAPLDDAVSADPTAIAEILENTPAQEPPADSARATAATPPAPASETIPSKLPWAPRRYEVAADGSIVVRPEETLGHFADWLGVRTQRLRDLNGLHYGDALGIGKRVRLDFSKVDHAAFETRRLDHHRSLQMAFFDDFAVAGTQPHVMRRGETLWKISRGKYDVPVWLIQQYNPSLDVNSLQPGMRIHIPKVQPRAKG